MKQPMVAVYDKKTKIFDRPFAVRHIGEALREWDIVKKDSNNKIGKNPEDFDLYELGSYDDETGMFEQIQPTHLGTGQ